MFMFKRFLELSIVIALLIASPLRAAGQHGDSIVVAYVPGVAGDSFYVTLQSGIMQGFEDGSARVAFIALSPARFSVEEQIARLEEVIARGDVDYLLVAPVDSQLLIPVLEKAYHAGIKIITVDAFIGDGDYASGSVTFPLAHIGPADGTSGYMACRAAPDACPIPGALDHLRAGNTRAEIIARKPFDIGYWAAVLAVAHARGYESIPKRVPVDTVRIDAGNVNDPALARYFYSDTLLKPQPTLTNLTIAFVMGVQRDPPDPFYVTLAKGVQAAAGVYGVHVVTGAPAHFSPDEQIPVIEDIIATNHIDYMIAAPTDRDALIPILRQISESGIPVITVDTFIGDGDYESGSVTFPLTYIGSDNVMGGYIACSQLAMADILGTGAKIYIQNVRRGISTTDQREAGCLAAAADFELEVVKIDYSDNVVEDSRAQTIQMLAEHPDIVGIFGTNVFSAQGAGAAVWDVGLGGIVEVVAFDATEFAIDLLRNGTVTQVIAQKPADMGYFAVLSAVAHARGIHSIPKRWSTGYEVINLNNVDDPQIARFIYREK
jgi:ribose transport system substrate-binding protein